MAIKKPEGSLAKGFTKLSEEHCIGRAVVDQLCGEVYREEYEEKQERHASGYDDEGRSVPDAGQARRGYTKVG